MISSLEGSKKHTALAFLRFVGSADLARSQKIRRVDFIRCPSVVTLTFQVGNPRDVRQVLSSENF